MALSSSTHRAVLKQQNKKHNKLGHRTKGQLASLSRGRVNVKFVTRKPVHELSRADRKNRQKQIRSLKREEVIAHKRSLGMVGSPPFLVMVLPLSPVINPRSVVKCITSCDDSALVRVSAQGITHMSCPRFKQRFSFVVPPVDNLYAILDTAKVSDTVLFVWPPEEDLDDSSENVISAILAQGLPSPVHAVQTFNHLAQKGSSGLQQLEAGSDSPGIVHQLKALNLQSKSRTFLRRKHQSRQNLQKDIEARSLGLAKVFALENQQESLLLLRQIGAQKQRSVFFRDHRSHLIAEDVCFEGEGTSGSLLVQGYIRGQPLSANGLIHIPGWGEFQLSSICTTSDPHASESFRTAKLPELQVANPDLQETLQSVNEIDPMEGEQTWPTEEEIKEACKPGTKKDSKVRRVPKGTSEYQAAWIVDSDDEATSVRDEAESNLQDPFDQELKPIDVLSQEGEDGSEDEDSEEYDSVAFVEGSNDNYDETVDYDADMKELKEIKAAQEDTVFPDEIDTPVDIPARIRFQKYRGLQSFRTSHWDPKENLPADYARIFQFQNFNHTRKKILTFDRDGILPGSYVSIEIVDVPRHLYSTHVLGHSPLVIFGILPHEQKMSVMNIVLKSRIQTHLQPIRSKERLIFHVGFRRFANCPIFSEHSTGNKHKFARYFHPGQTVVATMFAPITYSPASVLMFRETSKGVQHLLAVGSLYSMDPNRTVCKRVILSGHPFKINKKTAVLRYMFFQREDILWFKPVELRTKWGRRGHIVEPLGTHGHMKCVFDGFLKSQDTVLMNLYKRVYPKWTFDPYVRQPSPLYTCSTYGTEKEKEELVPQPPSKRQKQVHFM